MPPPPLQSSACQLFFSSTRTSRRNQQLLFHHLCRQFTTTNNKNKAASITRITRTSNTASSSLRPIRQRPIVHLSSAPGQKYKAKAIGTSHPVIPHKITPSLIIPDYLNIVHPPPSPYIAYASPKRNNDAPLAKIEGHHQKEQLEIHNEDSIVRIRMAAQLAAQMLQLASSLLTRHHRTVDGSSSYSTDQQSSSLTTNDIDIAIHNAILQHKAYPSKLNHCGFPKSICTSVNEVACRGVPDLRPLQYGDVVSLDVSVYLDGFHGDNCTTIMVGQDYQKDDDDDDSQLSTSNMDDDDQIQRGKAIILATKQAMYEAISVCKAGVEISEIGNTIQDVAHGHGYRPMKNSCGRGIGKYLHMLPEVKVSRL